MKDILNSSRFWVDTPPGRSKKSFTVALSGLNAGYAEIGATIGFSTGDGVAPDGGVKWSGSADPAAAADFGTGTSPTDFSAVDGAVLYLHATHEGTVVTTSAPVRQAFAPTVIAPAGISGDPVENTALTGSPASFSGDGLTLTERWEVSSDGVSGWNETGAGGLVSPAQVLGDHYRFVSRAENSRGAIESVSDVVGPVTEPVAASIAITDVTVTETAPDRLGITITATGAEDGDTVHWVALPATDVTPAAAQICAGTDAQDTAAVSGSAVLTGGAISMSGVVLDPGDYKLAIAIQRGQITSNGLASNVFAVAASASFTLTPVGATSYSLTGDPSNVDLSTVSAGDWLVIAAVQNGVTAEQISDVVLAGTSATMLHASPGAARKSGFAKIQCPAAAAGSPAAEVTIGLSAGGNESRFSAAVWRASAEPQLGVTGTDEAASSTSVTLNVTTGRALVAALSTYGTDISAISGITRDFDVEGVSGRDHDYASAGVSTSEARTISATADDSIRLTVVELYPA